MPSDKLSPGSETAYQPPQSRSISNNYCPCLELFVAHRVYVLKGFPATETDAAQFLEENNAFYSAPHKKHKGTGPPPPTEKRGDKPAFLSALDAVIQITTR